MKTYQTLNIMKKYASYTLAIMLLLTSCENWLDINQDPNSPSTPDIQQLIPGIAYDIADDFSMAYGTLGYACAVYTHQLCTRQPEYDKYNVSGSAYGVSTYWQDLYSGPLQDLEIMIQLGEENGDLIYAGIGKILKAYTFSQIVDIWGDVPYTEANVSGNVTPVFDNDEAIYASLFDLLDEGIADLLNEEATNYKSPDSDDLFYGGEVELWVKAANTIKLKLYNQVRLTSMYNESEVNTLVADPTQLIGANEDFLVPFGTSSLPENRHPAFVSEYNGAQISNYISPWFFEIMNGENPDIFYGIEDPRIPFYFVNQLAPGGATENPPEYKNGDFVSLYFGSDGINRDHAGRATFTMMGIYPVGGKFDDQTGGGPLGGSDGTGAAPQRLLTYADRCFIEAELMLTGRISGDVREKFIEAVNASFDQVDMVVDMVSPSQVVPSVYEIPGVDSTYAFDEYLVEVLNEFDAADNDGKLEIVMTQKWISSWGSCIDQYTDYRRTGYPVMFDATSNGGTQSGGPDGSGSVPTSVSKSYPLSFPYDADEITLNPNSPNQKVDLGQEPVFWDVNQ